MTSTLETAPAPAADLGRRLPRLRGLRRPRPDGGAGRGSTGRSRLGLLDALRFAAALLVLLKHYVASGYEYTGPHGSAVDAWPAPTRTLFPHPLVLIASYGWTGVELFFLISGFVVCMSSWGRGLGSFATSRAARLLPAYWFAVLLTAAVAVEWPGMSSGRYPGRLSDILVNLTFTQHSYGTRNLDPVYWTLWSEIRFYLLFSAVVAFGLTYRRVLLFCCAWTVASIAAAATKDALLVFVFQPQYSPYYIAGIAMYLIYRFGATPLLLGITGFCWLLAQHLIRSDTVKELGPDAAHLPTWPATVALIAFFAVMLAVALHWTDAVRWRRLTTLGAVTYPLYLIHQDVGLTIIHYQHGRGTPLEVLAAVTALMLLAAWLVHRFVERPGSRLIRRGAERSLRPLRQSAS